MSDQPVKRFRVGPSEKYVAALEAQLSEAISQRQSALDAMAERLRGEMESAAEERARLRVSLAEYVEAFKAEAADNIALKNELAAANQDAEALRERLKVVEQQREVARGRARRDERLLNMYQEQSYLAWGLKALPLRSAVPRETPRLASQPPAEAEGA